MAYASVDPTIQAWVKKHGFTLFTGTEGMEEQVSRSVYVSSPAGECFQIWVSQPEAGRISVHAADVETRGDEELRSHWSVPLSELGQALEEALSQVRKWMNR